MADLVERLGRGCNCGKCKMDLCCCHTMEEAKDRIERLEAEIARAIVSAHTADLHGEVGPGIVENEWFDWLPEARALLPIIEKAVQAGMDAADENASLMDGLGHCDARAMSASEIVKEMCGE